MTDKQKQTIDNLKKEIIDFKKQIKDLKIRISEQEKIIEIDPKLLVRNVKQKKKLLIECQECGQTIFTDQSHTYEDCKKYISSQNVQEASK